MQEQEREEQNTAVDHMATPLESGSGGICNHRNTTEVINNLNYPRNAVMVSFPSLTTCAGETLPWCWWKEEVGGGAGGWSTFSCLLRAALSTYLAGEAILTTSTLPDTSLYGDVLHTRYSFDSHNILYHFHIPLCCHGDITVISIAMVSSAPTLACCCCFTGSDITYN